MAKFEKYASELQELLNIPDGSIDDTQEIITAMKLSKIENYKERVNDISKDIRHKDSSKSKRKSRNDFSSTIKEFIKVIADSVKIKKS